jgi:hypothetical protein
MNGRVHILVAVIMILGLAIGPAGSIRAAAPETTVITLTIGNPNITVNGTPRPIDANGSTPIIVAGRTLLPIRAVVEAIGGTIEWNATTRTVTIAAGSVTMGLTIGNRMATVGGVRLPIDSENASVVPLIVGGRTMLPVRFVGEQLGGTVEWNAATRTATLAFVAPAALTAPSLLEPTDGALFTSTTVAFRWAPVDGATSYSLSLSSEGKEIYRGTSATSTLIPSSAVLTAGEYSWTITAVRGATTGPVSLPRRFTVQLPMSAADIVKKVTPAVAEVKVEYATGGHGVASAFAVETRGVFVTTYEVIKGAVSGSLVLADGSERTSLRVLGYDAAHDIAILTSPTDKAFPALTLGTDSSARLNQDAVMVGPVISGIPQFTVAGVVNAVTSTGFTIRGDASSAVEGSPVLDQFGDVIGMVTAGIKADTGTFPAVSAATIRAVSRAGDWTLAQVTEREGTGLQSVNAPVLGEPVGEATVATLAPHFRWNTVAGATRYQFWIGEGRNATGEGLFSLFVDDTTAYISPGNLKPGTVYTWAVRAGNEHGWGPWSPDRMFTTSSGMVQLSSPAILEPLDKATVKAASPVLFWTSVYGADQYYVWIGLSDDETVYETSSPLPSVTIPAGTLVSGVTYTWLVRVENSSQVSSLWSPQSTFTLTIPTGLGVPSLAAPTPGAILSTLNPTFSWQAVSGATRYDLWIDKGTSDTKVYEVVVTGTSWTVPVGTLQAGQTYWWTVIAGGADAWSKTGDTWNWSLGRKFTLTADASPTIIAPTLQEPANGSTLATPSATLRWTTIVAANWYRVWVGKGTSSATSTAVFWKDVNNPGTGPTQQLVLPAGILERGATYWWHIIAGSGTDTATSEFSAFVVAP